MSKEKVSLKACEGIVGDKGAAYLLHALLTTNWADERIFVKKGWPGLMCASTCGRRMQTKIAWPLLTCS
jgi:hypothetical protein